MIGDDPSFFRAKRQPFEQLDPLPSLYYPSHAFFPFSCRNACGVD